MRPSPRNPSACWTCRVRRKKCDQQLPVCTACATLHIHCHYSRDRPLWMDGGVRQNEMAEMVKREVRANSYLRMKTSVPPTTARSDSLAEPLCQTTTLFASVEQAGQTTTDGSLAISSRTENTCPVLSEGNVDETPRFTTSDTFHIMFYLDHLLPLLFPYYCPPAPQDGGRAWILELTLRSPTIRQALLCQSSLFLSLKESSDPKTWDMLLSQSGEVFDMLRHALDFIARSSISDHMCSAIRIMAGIIQVQRFEVAALSFNNCQAHLTASSEIFEQLLDTFGTGSLLSDPKLSAPSNIQAPDSSADFLVSDPMPPTERAAFAFSSSLLIFDDIISSTVLQRSPRLSRFHQELLASNKPLLDLEKVVGCQNWVMLGIAEICGLEEWKQQRLQAKELDTLELATRAALIKDSLHAHLSMLNSSSEHRIEAGDDSCWLDLNPPSTLTAKHGLIATQIWTHAAFIWLHVVISGWQPANASVRYHVKQVIELLTLQLAPAKLLRAHVWPFFVAGCLAEPCQEAQFRRLAESLRPQAVFGTVKKALDIMEHEWHIRRQEYAADRNLADCLRTHTGFILLV